MVSVSIRRVISIIVCCCLRTSSGSPVLLHPIQRRNSKFLKAILQRFYTEISEHCPFSDSGEAAMVISGLTCQISAEPIFA
ncbi:hypothetical protein ARMSODRAFT_962642 [Armillaria solidipes]|uniref:Secreted protein n=1 Tax=Armillaria solidipes TaxID=1076256 RepID=A0A2H3AZ04_9AGAR|nr:hypothetical protein ARMSODRAFT_962642 [Armillaria solidipes]